MGQNCKKTYSTTAIHRKRINWCLILQFFTSDFVKKQFLFYCREHKKVKSESRQAHNFLIHYFGRNWCDQWLNPDFYNEAIFVSELHKLCKLHEDVRKMNVYEV